jgi:ketosteroid isomerase-like protein
MTPEEQRNAEVVRRLGELWNAGDYEGVLELYSDDVVMTAAPEWPDPGPWVGKEGVGWNQRQWLEAWDEVQLVTHELAFNGDKVLLVGEWNSRGTASGFGGQMEVIFVLTLRDGLITHFDWFSDADEARRAAGLA